MNVAERIDRSAGVRRAAVHCLGRFRLLDPSGDQLQIRTRKARAMLAALALCGRPMSRDSLADLLWSDRGEAQARASLRQTIFELQHFGEAESFLAVGRDDVAIRPELLATDIKLIRVAAADGNWEALLTLLRSSDAGLLTDLDGLDSEFDSWLRVERAHEPAATLAFAIEAAERSIVPAGHRMALDIVSEVLRLDPVNEEATRLAIQIDHELGDSGSLHRHFNALKQRLRDEYDAEPSQETTELFARLANGNGAGPDTARPVTQNLPLRAFSRSRGRLAALAIGALALSLVAFLLFSRADRPTAADHPLLVAVLPFEGQGAQSDVLSEGLWDDTRTALSRNSGLRILGRTTTRSTLSKGLSPDEYRRRFGVDYLLEASVRRNGTEVLVTASLTRTSDGVAVWEDAFRGRMGDPIALQEAIANSIEGRLRGRLAAGGGKRPQQISTSPEVYALFSEARTLLRDRDVGNSRRAQALLRQAVAIDPNFAPAWAYLGAAIYFGLSPGPIIDSSSRSESIAAVRHALSLAPNLAPAHSILTLVEGANSPAAEPSLRRALELDPSDAEAWNWLGNSLNSQYRPREALSAYQRALALDPLWQVPADNLVTTATDLGDSKAVNDLIDELQRAGASSVAIAHIRAEAMFGQGDYSGAVQLLMKIGRNEQGAALPLAWPTWFQTLSALGYFDTMHPITGCPEWFAPMVAGKALPPTEVAGKKVTPEEFLTSLFFSAAASRSLVNHGRSEDLARIYHEGFPTSDQFISRSTDDEMFVELVPTIAVALNQTGKPQEASYLLSVAAGQVERGLGFSPRYPKALFRLALIRAAQGQRDSAARLLSEAIARGFRPDGHAVALDLADEPAFRALRGEPRFEAARKRILDHIAQERAELGPLKL